MADETTQTQGTQTQTAGTGASSTPPSGRTISNEDYERYTRYENQVKGFTPFFEAARKHGFEKPEHFEPIAKIKAKGVDISRLSDLLAGEREDDRVGNGPVVDFDKKLAEMESKIRREVYEREHKSGVDSESRYLTKLADEIAGEDATEWDKLAVKRALEAEVWESGARYDDGHPLRDSHRRPLGENDFKPLAEKIRGLRDKAKGEGMKRVADAALKPPPKSTAGGQGNQGKSQTTTGNPREDFRNDIKAVAEAQFAKK